MDSLKAFEGSTLKDADEVYKKEASFRETIAKNNMEIEMFKNSSDAKLYKNISESVETEKDKLQKLKSGQYD